MSKCGVHSFDVFNLLYGEEPRPPCLNEATHYACEPFIGVKVCGDHKCRCAKYQDPIEVVDAREKARKEPTPNHWMAL